jgi:hypothetical protein
VDGPAVLLVGPDAGLTDALLKRFAAATLVNQPKRLGGASFDLYIVKSLPQAETISATTAFVHNLQLIDTRAYKLNYNYSNWVVTNWRLLRTEPPRFQTTYSYILTASRNGNAGQSQQSYLNFSSLRAGDQLLVAFDLPSTGVAKHDTPSTTVRVQAVFFTGYPDILSYGLLRLETFVTLHTPQMLLLTGARKESIALSA